MADQIYAPPPQPAASALEQLYRQHGMHPATYAPSAPPPRQQGLMHSPEHDLQKTHSRSLRTEKALTAVSAGLLSMLVIALCYVAVFASSDFYRRTVAPLIVASVLVVAAILAALYLCAVPGILSKVAIVPIIFAVVGGAMIIVLNTASKALSDGGFVRINMNAVLLSGGVFGGLGLGATAGFVLLAGNEEWG